MTTPLMSEKVTSYIMNINCRLFNVVLICFIHRVRTWEMGTCLLKAVMPRSDKCWKCLTWFVPVLGRRVCTFNNAAFIWKLFLFQQDRKESLNEIKKWICPDLYEQLKAAVVQLKRWRNISVQPEARIEFWLLVCLYFLDINLRFFSWFP